MLGRREWTLETDDDTYEAHARPKSHDILSLLQVCRQIYEDAAHLPFLLNTFSANSVNELNTALKILARFRSRNILDAITSIHISHYLHHDPEFWRYHYFSQDQSFWALTFSEIKSLLITYPALKMAHFEIIPDKGPEDWIVWGPNEPMDLLRCRTSMLFNNLKSRNPGVQLTISLHIYRYPGKILCRWKTNSHPKGVR